MTRTVALLLAWGVPLSARAEVPVKGDPAAFAQVRAALAENASRFLRGSFRFTADDRVAGKRAEMRLVWDGPRTRWTGWHSHLGASQVGATGVKSEREYVHRVDIIQTPEFLHGYWPERGWAQTSRAGERAFEKWLHVRPDELWFALEGVVAWQKLLDPAQAGENVTGFTVEHEAGQRVRIERRHDSGGVIRVIAALEQGANIIEYQTIPGRSPLPEVKRHGSYRWARHDSGVWYLEELKSRRYKVNTSELDLDFTLSVGEFNPNPVLPRDFFEFASLQVAEGTNIEDVAGSTRKVWRRGGQPAESLEKKLRDMAGRLQEKGFSSKARAKQGR